MTHSVETMSVLEEQGHLLFEVLIRVLCYSEVSEKYTRTRRLA